MKGVMFFRKAISPVVAIALLLIISVVSVVSFQTWFSNYNSGLAKNVETKDGAVFGSGDSEVQILDLIGDDLYLKGSSTHDVNVTDIIIDKSSCGISVVVSKGQSQAVNVGNCVDSNAQSNKPDIVVLTNGNVRSKKFYVKNLYSSSCTIGNVTVNNGQNYTFYNSSSVPYGSSCSSQVRTCSEGTLSGDSSYSYESCSMDAPTTDFYLHLNGVTVVCDAAAAGESGIVNSINYTKRTSGQINTTNSNTTCTSGITNMDNLFWSQGSFNQDVSSWDVSSVTSMYRLFGNANIFNQSLQYWNTTSVVNMQELFFAAFDFNQNISNWDTSSATNMAAMFYDARDFNYDISSWDTSQVTTFYRMFYNADNFNQPIGNWNTSKVTSLRQMFDSNDGFNQPLNNWDVSSVTDSFELFRYATTFNQPLNNWNVSAMTNMARMFRHAHAYNQDLRGWCVSHQPTEPTWFATSAPIDSNGLKPIWGTCP